MLKARNLLSATILTLLGASATGQTASNTEFETLMDAYCTECHNFIDYSGGLDLEGLGPHNIAEMPEVGEKVIRRLIAGMMPPAGEPRPSFEELQAFTTSLEDAIDTSREIRPGRPGMHRLNRTEYQNTIRDLLNLQIDATQYLPADDSSRGFDNQAGALTLSPALLEGYLSTAMKVSRLAVGINREPAQTLYRAAEDSNQNYHIEGLPFGTRGGMKFSHNFPADGEYAFKIYPITLGNMGSDRPFGNISGEKLQVLIDGELVKVFDWDEAFDNSGDGTQRPTLDLRVPVSAGAHEIGITFVATNYAPGLDMNNDFELSTIETGGLPGFTWYPHVGSTRVDGPYNPSGVTSTASRETIFSCYPESADQETDCARHIMTRLSELAYRGKGAAAEVEQLMTFYENGYEEGGFEEGVALALQRMLSDPKFIYRLEDEPNGLENGEVYAVSDLDLASRLSFFLWSSIPDRELLELANAGQLSDPDVLDQQVRRMLEDPRSQALSQNFAGQWLALRSLESHAPVTMLFPDFDNRLRAAFRQETELLFNNLISNNRPMTELLSADYTFVNERLALHYGIEGVRGERYRRVPLDGELAMRRGILGNGSTLTVASQPGRTSPVMRGYWVLANLVGVEPPPPPPDVPELEGGSGDSAGNQHVPSLREQLEQHRSNPGCMGCHTLMDPIGFALEKFDAVGAYREFDNGNPIETSDVMYDGTPIEGAEDLQDFLVRYEDSITRNITQRMLTYALGRGMDFEDMPLVREVQQEAAQDDYRFHSMISAVVNSRAFLMNEKQPGEQGGEPTLLSDSGGN